MASGTQRLNVPPAMQSAEAPPVIAPLDIAGAQAALATAATRDDVGDIVLRYIVGAFTAGVMFVVRDGLALGHRGHGGSLSPNVVESLVIPLNVASAFKDVHERMQAFRGAPATPNATQDRFLRVVGYPGAPAEIMLVPVLVRGRSVGVIYAQQPLFPAGDGWTDLQALAQACGAAYLRIIIASKQK